ncbi:transposase [Aquisphaera insulae]|uniref:transposase n=1 Tax=Aquisphaera insulae TaxID=2712864 RepID=UPI0013EDE8A8|nr:transposase [Aquisphaera insulae]
MNTATGHRSLSRSLLLAGTIALGFATLWLVLLAWIGATVLESRRDGIRPPVERAAVAADGTPLIELYSYDDRDQAKVTYREADGRERVIQDRRDLLGPITLGGELDGEATGMQAGWPARIRPFEDENAPERAWYFVHDGKADGSGEFILHDRRNRREIGRLGLAGFRDGPLPPAERIPVLGEVALNYSFWSSAPLSIHSQGPSSLRPTASDIPPHLVFVPSGDTLRVADLAARTTKAIFQAPETIASVGVPTLWSYFQYGKESTASRPILVRAGSTVYRLDRGGKVAGTFQIPADIDRRSGLSWYELDDGRALVEYADPSDLGVDSPAPTQRVTYFRVDPDGKITGKEQLTIRTQSGWGRNRRAEAAYTAAVIPAPALLLAVYMFLATRADPRRSLSADLWALLSANWAAPVVVLALAAILALAAWRWSRGFGLSPRERAAWATFVLLLGIPGLVGFLLHRRWPARVSCPACGERSSCDHDACASCREPFPAPALKGTEIFA